MKNNRIATRALTLALALFLALTTPLHAIQNIGFPDDSRLQLNGGQAKTFNSARAKIQEALTTLEKYGGVDGESNRVAAALKSIASNAGTIQNIAQKSGNKSVAHFMSTLKSWSISGDADDRPIELIRKIAASVNGLKVISK